MCTHRCGRTIDDVHAVNKTPVRCFERVNTIIELNKCNIWPSRVWTAKNPACRWRHKTISSDLWKKGNGRNCIFCTTILRVWPISPHPPPRTLMRIRVVFQLRKIDARPGDSWKSNRGRPWISIGREKSGQKSNAIGASNIFYRDRGIRKMS